MKRVVALFARSHGLEALKALLESQDYQVVALATHCLKPLAEDLTRTPRVDFPIYKHLAAKARVPLFTVDSRVEQQYLESILREMEYDVIASVNWRRLIPAEMIDQATYGGVNLHRGRLPNYPGAEPIKQAILNGDRTIAISAHRLTDVIDGGEILHHAEYAVPAALLALPLDECVAAIRHEITPLFGPLLLQALELACVEQKDRRLLLDRR